MELCDDDEDIDSGWEKTDSFKSNPGAPPGSCNVDGGR